MKMTKMVKNRILYASMVLSLLCCGLWGGSSSAAVLVLLLLVLPVLSDAGLHLSMGGISLSLDGEHSCRSGQQMKLKLRMSYGAFRPPGNVWIRMSCENRIFGMEKEGELLLEAGRGRQQEYELPVDTDICGGRILKISSVRCQDLLGLFSCKKSVEETYAYIVYPYEAHMYVSFQKHREREQPGELYDGKKSGTDVSEVFGLREYREGDPLQSIHWKLSGKMKQLIVREFGRPVNYHILLLLAPALRYGGREVKRETAGAVFDLGASLSRALLDQSMAHFVGYLSGGDLHCTPVDSMHSYEDMLLKLMADSLPGDGDEVLLAFLRRQMYRQYTKIVCVTGAADEAAARDLSVMADLTVLEAVEGPSGYLAGSGGYEVVGISMENIRKKEHVIPL